jgi:ferredoxin, 2Fe-2S
MNFLVYQHCHSKPEPVQPMLDTTPLTGADLQDPPLLGVEIRLGGGIACKIEAAAGFNAMELMRAAGLPIKAECGGAGVCATCHCRVPEAWATRLPAASEDEMAKLDEIPSANVNSRLSCQIQFDETLDGLVLELQADSIHPRFLDAAQ